MREQRHAPDIVLSSSTNLSLLARIGVQSGCALSPVLGCCSGSIIKDSNHKTQMHYRATSTTAEFLLLSPYFACHVLLSSLLPRDCVGVVCVLLQHAVQHPPPHLCQQRPSPKKLHCGLAHAQFLLQGTRLPFMRYVCKIALNWGRNRHCFLVTATALRGVHCVGLCTAYRAVHCVVPVYSVHGSNVLPRLTGANGCCCFCLGWLDRCALYLLGSSGSRRNETLGDDSS